MGGKLTHTSR